MLEMELEKHLQVVVLHGQYRPNVSICNRKQNHSIQREQHEIMAILLDILN
jgi:hypothetical protein